MPGICWIALLLSCPEWTSYGTNMPIWRKCCRIFPEHDRYSSVGCLGSRMRQLGAVISNWRRDMASFKERGTSFNDLLWFTQSLEIGSNGLGLRRKMERVIL